MGVSDVIESDVLMKNCIIKPFLGVTLTDPWSRGLQEVEKSDRCYQALNSFRVDTYLFYIGTIFTGLD